MGDEEEGVRREPAAVGGQREGERASASVGSSSSSLTKAEYVSDF